MPLFARRLIVALLSCAMALPTAMAPARAQAPDLPALGDVSYDDLSPANERKLGEAITERGFEFFRDRGAIWLLRNDDPEPASLGNC